MAEEQHRIIDPVLYACVNVLNVHKTTEKQLNKDLDTLKGEMAEILEKYIDEYDLPLTLIIRAAGEMDDDDTIKVKIITQARTSINRDKLLERGVDPSLIADCMDETVSRRITTA